MHRGVFLKNEWSAAWVLEGGLEGLGEGGPPRRGMYSHRMSRRNHRYMSVVTTPGCVPAIALGAASEDSRL